MGSPLGGIGHLVAIGPRAPARSAEQMQDFLSLNPEQKHQEVFFEYYVSRILRRTAENGSLAKSEVVGQDPVDG